MIREEALPSPLRAGVSNAHQQLPHSQDLLEFSLCVFITYFIGGGVMLLGRGDPVS